MMNNFLKQYQEQYNIGTIQYLAKEQLSETIQIFNPGIIKVPELKDSVLILKEINVTMVNEIKVTIN